MKKLLIFSTVLLLLNSAAFAQDPNDIIIVKFNTWKNSIKLLGYIEYWPGGNKEGLDIVLNRCLNRGDKVSIDAGSALYGDLTFVEIDTRSFTMKTEFDGVFDFGTVTLRRGEWRAWFDDAGQKGPIPDALVGLWIKVANAKVTGKVLKHGRSKKITVFKYKPKKNYKKKQGHRQPFTRVVIESIEA